MLAAVPTRQMPRRGWPIASQGSCSNSGARTASACGGYRQLLSRCSFLGTDYDRMLAYDLWSAAHPVVNQLTIGTWKFHLDFCWLTDFWEGVGFESFVAICFAVSHDWERSSSCSCVSASVLHSMSGCSSVLFWLLDSISIHCWSIMLRMRLKIIKVCPMILIIDMLLIFYQSSDFINYLWVMYHS